MRGFTGSRSKDRKMDITGEGNHVIMTWAGLVHSGLGGMSSKDGGFSSNGIFSISSGGMALGKMGSGLVGVTMRGMELSGKRKNGVGL